MKIQHFINRSNIKANPHARRGGVMVGCLIALGVVVVIIIAIAIYAAITWKGWIAKGTVAITEQVIQDSSLPDSEKPEMIAIVTTFADRFKSGDITMEQFGKTLEEIFESNLFLIGNAYSADNGYIQASAGLTDEEKADGSLQMMRIAAGLEEGLISRDDFEAVFTPMIDTSQNASANGEDLMFFKDPSEVTDDELKQVIESARTLADDNSVTETPEMIDLSDMLQDEIDEALGETPAP